MSWSKEISIWAWVKMAQLRLGLLHVKIWKIVLKVPWIAYRFFKLAKMFFVYDGMLRSEIIVCMGSYDPKYIKFLDFFWKSYVFWKIRAKNVIFWNLFFEMGFFSSKCRNYTFILSPTIKFKNLWRYESNIYSHIESFYTHLLLNSSNM
jgi:hypothetical protein